MSHYSSRPENMTNFLSRIELSQNQRMQGIIDGWYRNQKSGMKRTMEHNEFTYCPHCATPLVRTTRFNQIRPVCPSCDYVYFLDPKVAVIAFVTHANRLLLIRRAVRPAKGKWALPGGYMDAGEMPEHALQRELREEVGLDVHIDHLLDIYPMAGPGVDNRGIVMAYAAVPVGNGGEQVLESNDDVSAAGWFGHDEIPDELAFESTRALLAAWRENL